MDKLDKKIMAKYTEPRWEFWKQHLTPHEQSIFQLYYYQDLSIIKIANLQNYSERQVKRLLKSARKKIYKLIP